jgi:hypothetical protein
MEEELIEDIIETAAQQRAGVGNVFLLLQSFDRVKNVETSLKPATTCAKYT